MLLDIGTYVVLDSGRGGMIVGYAHNLYNGAQPGNPCNPSNEPPTYYLIRLDQDSKFRSPDGKDFILYMVRPVNKVKKVDWQEN